MRHALTHKRQPKLARPRFRLTMTEPSEAQVLAGIKTLLSMHPAVAWWSRVNSGKGFLLRVTYED
jgi:hypothetical protein